MAAPMGAVKHGSPHKFQEQIDTFSFQRVVQHVQFEWMGSQGYRVSIEAYQVHLESPIVELLLVKL